MKRRLPLLLVLLCGALSAGMGIAAYRPAARARAQIPAAVFITARGDLPYPPSELWGQLARADMPVGCALEYEETVWQPDGSQTRMPVRYANAEFGEPARLPLLAGRFFSGSETPEAILNKAAFTQLFPGGDFTEAAVIRAGKTDYRVIGLWAGGDGAAAYVNRPPGGAAISSLLFIMDCPERRLFEAEALDILSEAIGFPVEGQAVALWAYRDIPLLTVCLGITVSLAGLAFLLLFESVGEFSRGYGRIAGRNGKWIRSFLRALLFAAGGIGVFWISLLFVRLPAPLLPSESIFDISHYVRIYSDFISQGGFLSGYARKVSETVPWTVGLSLGMALSFWAGLAVWKVRTANYKKQK